MPPGIPKVSVRQREHPDDRMMRRLKGFSKRIVEVYNPSEVQRMAFKEYEDARHGVLHVQKEWSGPHEHSGQRFWMNVSDPQVVHHDPLPDMFRSLDALKPALVELALRSNRARKERSQAIWRSVAGLSSTKAYSDDSFEKPSPKSKAAPKKKSKLPPLKVPRPVPRYCPLGPIALSPRSAFALQARGMSTGYHSAALHVPKPKRDRHLLEAKEPPAPATLEPPPLLDALEETEEFPSRPRPHADSAGSATSSVASAA